MQFDRTWWNRLVAFFDPEPYHHFRCFDCKREVLTPGRFLTHARLNGCDHCGGTLIPHDQSMGICCPECPAELVSTGTLVRADYEEGIHAIECDGCATVSVWHMNAIPGALRLKMDPEELPAVDSTGGEDDV